jgi:hypothetical protein
MLWRVRNSRGRAINAPAAFIHPCRHEVGFNVITPRRFNLNRVHSRSGELCDDSRLWNSRRQAAPANGWAVGSAVKAISPLDTIYYYRRRYRRRRYRRYRW